MKITKRQLRRIIKEEKSRVLSEQPLDPMDKLDAQDIIDGYYNTINQLVHDEWAQLAIDLTAPDGEAEVEYVKEALRRLLTDLEGGNF